MFKIFKDLFSRSYSGNNSEIIYMDNFKDFFTTRQGRNLIRMVRRNPIINSAVNIIAENISSKQLELIRKADGEELVYINKNVQEILSGIDISTKTSFKQSIHNFIYSLILNGEAFFYYNPVENSLKYIPVKDMDVHWENGAITRYLWNNTILENEYVIHGRNTDSSEVEKVISSVASLDSMEQLDNAGKKLNYAVFKNGGIKGFFNVKTETNEEGLQKMSNLIKDGFLGEKNEKKMAFVGAGLEYTKVGSENSELQMGDLINMTTKHFLMGLRVPKEMLGNMDNTNRASSESAEYFLSKYSCQRFFTIVEDCLNFQLLPLLEKGENISFRFKDKVPADKEYELKKMEIMAGLGLKTINEMRKQNGFEEIAGGEKISTNRQIIDISLKEEVKEEEKKQEEKKPKKGKNDKEEVGEKNPEKDKKKIKKSRELIIENSRNIEIWHRKQFEKNSVQKTLDIFLEEQEKRIVKKLNERSSDDIFDEEKERKITIATFETVFGEIISESYKKTFKNVPDSLPSFKEELRNQLDLFSESITETTSKQLKETISESVKNSEDLKDLTARVKNIFINKKNSKTIAITETNRAINSGEWKAYEELGVKKIRWNANLNSNTRHDGVHETVREFGKNFSVNGHSAKKPMDENLPAGESINCKCFLSPAD